jgi:hypothetical protein
MSGEFNGFVLLGILWLVLSLITQRRPKTPRTPHPKSPSPARPRPLPGSPDATQQEGLRLESVLRELQRSLEQAASTTQAGELPAPPRGSPAARKGEIAAADSESRSLEEDVEPEVRRVVDLDEESAEVEARRIQAAEARNLAVGRARERPVALEQITPEPAEHTASRSYSAKQLRDAVVWREILGPPVSER